MVKIKRKNIYIFRKDLRLHEKFIKNSSFYYFWDDEKFRKEKRGDHYKSFLKKILNELKKEIEDKDGEMEILQGSLYDNIASLVSQKDTDHIFLEKQYLPWEKDEEKYLLEKFKDKVNLLENKFLLTAPGEVLKKDGSPYVVFTPFYNKWQRILEEKNTGIIDKGNQIIDDFFDNNLKKYGKDRDIPWKEGTSNFSKYLNAGVISPESIYNKALTIENKGEDWELFIRQLAWRDFYYQLYYYYPYVLNKAFKSKYENIFWENNKEFFKKWTQGLTGYPFVDAGMRQLQDEGFMHNRLRMMTASFLTKDLLIDWKKGEEYFMEQLVDGDLILNNGGWQWSASTGADPQPYFRIFNPVTQSKRFDSEGRYIKKYIPELKNVPLKFIHEPWKMSLEEQKKARVIIGKDYPKPIVEHKEQRAKALEIYKI